MFRTILLTTLISLSINLVYANDIENFIGLWSVNVEKTVEELKLSPKFDPKNEERDKKMLRNFAGAMQLELKKSSITYLRGKRSTVIPYRVISSTPSSFSAEVDTEAGPATLSFSLHENKFLNVKSSASDDMNLYIWQASAKGLNVDSELKVMTNILLDK